MLLDEILKILLLISFVLIAVCALAIICNEICYCDPYEEE